MERCPKCRRFGLKQDGDKHSLMCIWRECSWRGSPKDLVDCDYGNNFKEFYNAITAKREN